MRRVFLFVFVGPLLGYICILLWNHTVLGLGSPRFTFLFVLFAYVSGFVPAFIACAVDYYLDAHRYRVVLTTVVGCVATVLFVVVVSLPKIPPLSDLLWYGLIGAIPAAICSWLSGIRLLGFRPP